MAVFQFIEGWYNPYRPHSGLGDRSPIELEHRTRAEKKLDQATCTEAKKRLRGPEGEKSPRVSLGGELGGEDTRAKSSDG
jgi:hypothetical protein